MKNYYKILSEGSGGKLSLNKNSSHQDIKAAYRAMAIKHHPDKGGNPELFRRYQEAYEVLSNEDKRRRHDAELESGYSFSAHNNSASANLDPNDIDLKLFSKLFTIIMFPFFIIPLMNLFPILLPFVIMANITKLVLNLVLLPFILLENLTLLTLKIASLPMNVTINICKAALDLASLSLNSARNMASSALDLALLPVIKTKNMAKSGLNLALLSLNSARNKAKSALDLALSPVITIKNMAKSGLNLASLPVSSAWNMAKSGFNLIYNEFSHDAEPDGEVYKSHDDAIDASNSFNKAPAEIGNPLHSLAKANIEACQSSVHLPPIQESAAKGAAASGNHTYSSSKGAALLALTPTQKILAKVGLGLIHNELSNNAKADSEAHKRVDASNPGNNASIDKSNPHHSLVNNKPYQGSVDSPLTPIQRNTPKPESKPNTSFPSSYTKICGKSSNRLDKALKLLDDYTKGNSASSRFFHGHWNRHYVLEVNKIVNDIRGQKINSVTALLESLNRIDIKNEKGSLARRKQYIELHCQSPDVESPNRTMGY